MPPVHRRKEGFWSRLHDVEKVVSLKDVSDNLKNYAIAGGAYALGVKLTRQTDGFTFIAGYVLCAVGVLFLVATFCQSWVLAQKQSQEMVPFTVNDRIRNGWKPALKLWLYLLVPISLALVAATSAIWWARSAT